MTCLFLNFFKILLINIYPSVTGYGVFTGQIVRYRTTIDKANKIRVRANKLMTHMVKQEYIYGKLRFCLFPRII